jgi:hypothetical protein
VHFQLLLGHAGEQAAALGVDGASIDEDLG